MGGISPLPKMMFQIPEQINTQESWHVTLKGTDIVLCNSSDYALQKQKSDPELFMLENKGIDYHTAIKVKDGWLVALNKGEFGGSVWWYSKNLEHDKKIAELNDVNVIAFFEVKERIFAVAGLSHMALHRKGGLFEFQLENSDNWSIKKVADFAGYPVEHFFSGVNNKLYTVVNSVIIGERFLESRSSLLEVSLEGEITYWVDNGFWRHISRKNDINKFHPTNSLAHEPDSGDVYIGLSLGVAKITAHDKNVIWLVPPEYHTFLEKHKWNE